MSVLIGHYGIQFTIAEACLVNAQARADVLWEYEIAFSMSALFGYPITVAAQVAFILTLKLLAVDVIVLLKRRSRYRVLIQAPLLKKRQTLSSAVCPLLQVHNRC